MGGAGEAASSSVVSMTSVQVLTKDFACRHETFAEMVRHHVAGKKAAANGRRSSSASLSSMSSQRTGVSKAADMPIYGSQEKL